MPYNLSVRCPQENQMPVYEYRCPDCASTYEKLVRLSESSDEAACPSCGGRGKKLLSVFASLSRGGSDMSVPAAGGGCCGGGCCAG